MHTRARMGKPWFYLARTGCFGALGMKTFYAQYDTIND